MVIPKLFHFKSGNVILICIVRYVLIMICFLQVKSNTKVRKQERLPFGRGFRIICRLDGEHEPQKVKRNEYLELLNVIMTIV